MLNSTIHLRKCTI